MSYLNLAAQVGAQLNASLNSAEGDADHPDHLPRTESDLASLTIGQRILSSAVAASGCDAVAYYVPDGKGQFAMADHLDLYDFDHKHPTEFPLTLDGFHEGTYATEASVRATSDTGGYYQLPVRDEHGELKAIVVLHPPQDGYVRIQNAVEAQKNREWRTLPPEQKATTSLPDAHEPAAVRIAKLQMAGDIIDNFSTSLLQNHNQMLANGQDIGTAQEREAFLLKMAKDMFRSFPKKDAIPADAYAAVMNARNGEELRVAVRPLLKHDDAMQGPHTEGVADLMKYSVEALNEHTRKRHRLTSDDQNTVELLAMLHDIGKSQFSYAFFQDWTMKGKTPEETAEQKQRNSELVGRNANHAYLDNVVLSLYPSSAKIVADHHHGHDRYTQAELTKNLGDQGDHYVIATNHIAPDQVHMLSRMLRVADVMEAKTARATISISDALRQMAEGVADFGKNADGSTKSFKQVAEEIAKGGAPSFTLKPMDPNTIDRDALCFMIEHRVFQKYGAQRNADEIAAGNAKGWVDPKGNALYNAQDVQAVGDAILQALHWDERKQEKAIGTDGKQRSVEKTIQENVQDDALFATSHASRAIKRSAENSR